MTAVAVVWEFAAAWNRMDVDEMIALLHEDAVFQNVPMELIVGRPAIRAALTAFVAACENGEWQVTSIAQADDGAVLVERIDIFTLKSGAVAHCPTMGKFVVSDAGLITLWRDYFDLSDWNRQFGIGADEGRKATPGV